MNDDDLVVAATALAILLDEREHDPRSGCYRCGGRLYYSSRLRGDGLCGMCSMHIADKSDAAIGAMLRGVAWSPYPAPR